MKIKLGKGIGDLVFGMTPHEIQKLLGKPDIKRIDDEDESRLIFVFNKQKTRLTFHLESGNKLAYIETSNDNVTFNEEKVIGSNAEFAKKDIFGSNIKEWEVENYNTFTAHFNEKYWFSLHSEFEIVTFLELGVPFINDEEYNWPKIIND